MGQQPEDNVQTKKKIKPTTREVTGAAFMLRCAELNLTDEALRGMTIGMVYDLLAEKANDLEEYPTIGDQEDIQRIFG